MFRYLMRNIFLITREIVLRVPKVFLSSFGILFLISIFILFLSLRSSIRVFMENRIFNRLGISEMRVTPPGTSSLSLNIFTQSQNQISEGKVRRIKRIPGIRSIQKVIRLNMPASVKVGMFGRYLRSDILISGVERSFFRGSDIDWKRFTAAETVPVVIPLFAIDLYNNYAAANNLPEVGEKVLLGFSVDIIVGRSSLFKGREEKHFRGVVYGFTDRLTTSGIVVPSEFIRDFCKEQRDDFFSPERCYSTSMLFVTAQQVRMLPDLAKRIENLKLHVESHRDIAEKTSRAMGVIDGTFFLLLIIVLALTGIAIFNAYLAMVYHRSYEISLERMLGASKMRIVLIFILEAAVVGAIYGIAGYYLGRFMVQLLSENISEWIPMLKGFRVMMSNGMILPVSILLSISVSVLSAFIPALFATNMNLFRDLKRF